MAGKRWYKWTVEIQVERSWVADGFELDNDRAHDMLASTLPHALGFELKAKVLTAPPLTEILHEQGYRAKDGSLLREIQKRAAQKRGR